MTPFDGLYLLATAVAWAAFERGRKVGLNQARFCPPLGRAA